MAQLGDFVRARRLLLRAERGLTTVAGLAALLVAAGAIALASRDLANAARGLDEAARVFAAHGDRANARFAELIAIRQLVLLGRVAEAQRDLPPSRWRTHQRALNRDRRARQGRRGCARLACRRSASCHRASAQSGQERRHSVLVRGNDGSTQPAGTRGSPAGRREPRPVARGCRGFIRDARARSGRLPPGSYVQDRSSFRWSLRQPSWPLLALAEQAPEQVTREQLLLRALKCQRRSRTIWPACAPARRARALRKAIHELADVQATAAGFAVLPRVRLPVFAARGRRRQRDGRRVRWRRRLVVRAARHRQEPARRLNARCASLHRKTASCAL